MNQEKDVAIVTGCGSAHGIGRAIALRLAKDDVIVIAADMDLAGAADTAALVRQEGGTAEAIKLDVSDEANVNAVVTAVVEKFGRIDILVNNAGISQSATVEEITLEDWNRLLSINLTGVFLCTKAVLPWMKQRHYGRIVNTASVAGKRGGGIFGGPHYAATKAGVLGFSKATARETAAEGITVNCVAPGLINTDIWKTISKEREQRILNDIPMRRPGNVEEVAAAVAFLASHEASYITGEEIDINGGSHMD